RQPTAAATGSSPSTGGGAGATPSPPSSLSPRDGKADSGFGAALLGTAAPALGLATIVTVAIYLYPTNLGTSSGFWNGWGNYVAIGAGIAVAVIVAFVLASRNHPSPDRTNPRQYGELSLRCTILDARLKHLCDCQGKTSLPPFTSSILTSQAPLACAEVCGQYEAITEDLALQPTGRTGNRASSAAKWVTGSGFIDLWVRMHNAEEALFVLESKEQVVTYGLADESRLMGSTISNREDLLGRLRRAVAVLGGREYFSVAIADTLSKIPPENGFDNKESEEAKAHLILRDIRHAINDFRDTSREGLVRARNQLMWTGLVTGAVSYVLLVLAILVRTDEDGLVAAMSFFLVGAVIGLFDQLRVSAVHDGAEEDFGLGRARLVYTPVLSGLAGIGGVVLTAMLYATLSGSMLKYTEPPTPTPSPTVAATATPTTPSTGASTDDGEVSATASPDSTTSPEAVGEVVYLASRPERFQADATDTSALTVTTTPTEEPTREPVPSDVEFDPPPLSAIFDLGLNGFGLVIAAVFGLTPSLLVNRLQGQADKYKADLQSTSVQTRSG
ncbi:MAG: hypothetical protein QOJ59_1771, partial [Thermomicrobiales bacterium]|nr:hypothetical protein [Thermomicrobiales bacterium]